MDNKDLFLLEVIRNLIVHKAGIIDDEFIRKSSFSTESIGSKIIIDTTSFEKYEAAATESLVQLFEFSDNLCSPIK